MDVSIEKFIRAVQEEKPDIVAMSALLTTTMQMMKQTIDAFAAAGLRDRVKFIIGGTPVTEAYASQIVLTVSHRMQAVRSLWHCR